MHPLATFVHNEVSLAVTMALLLTLFVAVGRMQKKRAADQSRDDRMNDMKVYLVVFFASLTTAYIVLYCLKGMGNPNEVQQDIQVRGSSNPRLPWLSWPSRRAEPLIGGHAMALDEAIEQMITEPPDF